MIRHIFLDKTNTIVKKSELNMGLNPILQIGYGKTIMKGLLHFDIKKIRELIEDKTFANTDKLKFTLKMTNCFSIDGLPYDKELIKGISMTARRASSFDLMLYKLPMHFDSGRGYDCINDFWSNNSESFNKDASNWYCCKTGLLWNGELLPYSLKDIDGDIYETEFLKNEYEKFLQGDESIVIGTQHFDFGQENLSIDITKYVFDVLKDKNDINYGLCLSFVPRFEDIQSDVLEYVGFFNDNTNTFFHPYIEVFYNEYIKDDRESFTIGKNNNLYLYVSDDGFPVNLDNIPTCKIDGNNINVRQVTKGVYCASVGSETLSMDKDIIMYDKWSEIVLNGLKNEDVEMEFVTNDKTRKLSIGNNSQLKDDFVPSFYGINDDEVLTQNEVREVSVDFRKKYITGKKELIDSAEYRLYVMDGNRELDVIDYQPIEKTYLNNFFVVYTEDLIPNKYFIDIKVKRGREVKYYKKALKFKIVDNITERFQ